MRKSRQQLLASFCIAPISKTTFGSEKDGLSSDIISSTVRINIGDITDLGVRKTGFGSPRPKPNTLLGNIPLNPKIPGSFSTPEVELAKGHAGQAKIACIQQALSDGDMIPNASASSAWEFAAKGLLTTGPTIASLGTGKSIPLAFARPKTPPLALAKDHLCGSANIKHQACTQLLAKSTTEVPQAYYKSEVNNNPDLWAGVAEFLGVKLKDDETGEPI